jgi:hypothetical protein
LVRYCEAELNSSGSFLEPLIASVLSAVEGLSLSGSRFDVIDSFARPEPVEGRNPRKSTLSQGRGAFALALRNFEGSRISALARRQNISR